MRSRVRRSVLILAAVIQAACDKQEPKVATQIRITREVSTLSEGGSGKFFATVLDQNGDSMPGEAVFWQTDHPELASIDQTGLVTVTSSFLDKPQPLPPITVMATRGTLSAQAGLTLTVTGTFDVWPDTNVLYTGMTRAVATRLIKKWAGYESFPFTTGVSPDSVQWSTSDASVVTVSAAGVMAAVAPGQARIVAKYQKRLDTLEVYVKAPPATPLRFTSVTSDVPLLGKSPGAVFGIRGCGLATDGSIYCWGATLDSTQITDRCEQVGPGGVRGVNRFRFRCSEIPLQLPTDVRFTGLVTTTGGSTTYGASGCGLATTRRVYCWGGNLNGELGIGTVDVTTHGVAPVAGNDEFVELHGSSSDRGVSGVCGIRTDGALRCWGFGFGPTPVTIASPKTWRTLAAGGGCGLASDSTAYCLTSTSATSVGGTTRWKSIATAGADSPCAVALDDSVYCGSNLQDKQTIAGSIARLATYFPTFAQDIGVIPKLCALTSGGDLRCAYNSWGIINQTVKLTSLYGFCAIAVDQKVYCRPPGSPTLVLLPGQ